MVSFWMRKFTLKALHNTFLQYNWYNCTLNLNAQNLRRFAAFLADKGPLTGWTNSSVWRLHQTYNP